MDETILFFYDLHESVFFLGANFCNLATKGRLVNPTKGLLRFKKNNSPYLDQKNLEVAIFE